MPATQYRTRKLGSGPVPGPSGASGSCASGPSPHGTRSTVAALGTNDASTTSCHSAAAGGGSASCSSTLNRTCPECVPVIRNSAPASPAPHRPFTCPANAPLMSGSPSLVT